MTVTSPRVNAVLSVARAAEEGDYAVELSVSGDVPGVADRTAVATLSRAAARDLASDEAICQCLDQGSSPAQRMSAGKKLFDAVFPDDVASVWETLPPIADAGHWVRVRLDVQPPELAALPWELLSTGSEWLSLHRNISVWRGPAPKPATDPGQGPLRVLVVVCNPADQELLAEQEIARIADALAGQVGRQHVEILDGPGRPALIAEIDRFHPHVLHFIGHGMPGADRDTELAFNWVPPPGRQAGAVPCQCQAAAPATRWELASKDVGQLTDWAPSLVVMTACRTAPRQAAAGDPPTPSGGLVQAFLSAGTRAVVSMQADIQSKNVVPFSAALYRGLACSAPLEEAVALARRQIFREDDMGTTGDWALPVLTANTDPADVLRISFPTAEEAISGLGHRSEYSRLRMFVDQSVERRGAMHTFEPLLYLDKDDSRRLLVIEGNAPSNKKPGKTWFTYWCLLHCFLRGHQVTYVDLQKPVPYPESSADRDRKVASKQWLDAIRCIREACLSEDQLEPLAERAFDGFNTDLNALVSGLVKVGGSATPPVGPVPDQWLPFSEDQRNSQERARRICASFLSALQDSAGGRVHVIALDNAAKILDDDFSKVIYPALIRPVAEHKYPAIRIVLVTSDGWTGTRLPREDRELWTGLALKGFQLCQFMRLARDYCLRRGIDLAARPEVEELFRVMMTIISAEAPGQGVPVSVFESIFNGFLEPYGIGQP
jgi:hypothetical protein